MAENGKNIGRFEVTAELGRGSMGIVNRAHDPVMGRDVAIKTFLLPHGLSADDRELYLERFLREAQAAGRLSHPGIVTIYDFHSCSGNDEPFIAMEYVEGPTLHEVIEAHGAQDPEWVLDMAESLADALHTAHVVEIVHRDLKPANIIVRASDRKAKIADFGIARINTSDLTDDGVAMGSPAYMAPERLRGDRADARGDLFSLAVIVYEALMGTRPFDGPEFAATCYAIIHQPPPPCDNEEFDRFFEKALAKSPEDRFQTGAEFRDALISLRERVQFENRPSPPPRRRKTDFGPGAAEPALGQLDREITRQARRPTTPAPLPGPADPTTQTVRMNVSDILAAEALAADRLHADWKPATAASPTGPSKTSVSHPVVRHPTGRRSNPLNVGVGAMVLVAVLVLAAMALTEGLSSTGDRTADRAGDNQPVQIAEIIVDASPVRSNSELISSSPAVDRPPVAPKKDRQASAAAQDSAPIIQPRKRAATRRPAAVPQNPATETRSAPIASPSGSVQEPQVERRSVPDEAAPEPVVSPTSMAVVTVPLTIRNGIPEGVLNLFVDGRLAYTTALESDPSGRFGRLKKAVRRGEQQIEARLEMTPGAHELRVEAYHQAKDRTFERTLTVEIDDAEQRSLDIIVGRTLGRKLSVTLR